MIRRGDIPMKRITMLWVFVMAVAGCDRITRVSLAGATMGTVYNVTIASEVAIDEEALQREIDEELAWINRVMSTYIPESHLSEFNRSEVHQVTTVPAELIEVLRLSAVVHRISGGAFDVTVGPLVNLWGFGPNEVPEKVPDDAQISAARSRIGMHHLVIGNGTLSRGVDIYVDLSGIAKGYAVDRVSQLLSDRGFDNHLVEIGGELRALGVNDRDRRWVIAIEKPTGLARTVFRTLPLGDMAMATSGDYRNYRELDGKRYSHTIDPVAGAPIEHHLASVTVLHESAAMADGLATAINVLGPARGMTLAEEQDLAVLFIIMGESGFEESRSPAFEAYLRTHDTE